MPNSHIVPAIPVKSFLELEQKVELVKDCVDTVQVDVCDGRFVDCKRWPYVGDKGEFAEIIAEKRGLPFWDSVDYEFDLMVKEPESVIADYVRAGASAIVVHLESTTRMEDIIHEWKEAVKIGIAIRPATPLPELDSYMHEVTHVQFMGSDHIGHSGLTLDPVVFQRIREFRKKYPNHTLAVDIGVSLETAPELIAAGATHLAATSAIFGQAHPAQAIRELERLFL